MFIDSCFCWVWRGSWFVWSRIEETEREVGVLVRGGCERVRMKGFGGGVGVRVLLFCFVVFLLGLGFGN